MIRIHWFSFTCHCSLSDFMDIIYPIFLEKFGELQPLGHGGRGFRVVECASNGLKVYSTPLQGEYVHVELPGSACEAIMPNEFKFLLESLFFMAEQGKKFSVKRLDLAFDDCNFSPGEIFNAIGQDKMISLVKRESVVYIQSPWEINEKGVMGTSSLTIGSRSSQRLVRIYDLHGFTRLELQVRDERAELIAINLLIADYENWLTIGIGHLRQFIEFDLDAWRLFVENTTRYDIKISSPRTIDLNKMDQWLKNQVATALFVINELSGDLYKQELIDIGNAKFSRLQKSNKYKLLLSKCV